MSFQKYFVKNPWNGQIISDIVNDYCREYNPINILFVRTTTTGMWLDNLLCENSNVTRILCNTIVMTIPNPHPDTIIINNSDLSNYLLSLNKQYDMICVDPYHLYEKSNDALFSIIEYLSNTGKIICHDCCPKNESMASPQFVSGVWSGMTYLSFIKLAHSYPAYFYGVLDTDTGIGILSKTNIESLRTNLNNEKQEEILKRFDDGENVYNYFIENKSDLINVIYYSHV